MLGLSLLSGRPPIPVLMFHGLCERVPEYALYPGGRTCFLSLEDFSSVIQWCCQNFDVVRISELDDLLVGKAYKHRPLVLTFDDGLASVIDYALPVLREHQVPAVIFVTTEWTDAGHTPLIFQMERIIFNRIPLTLEVRIGDAKLQLEFTSFEQIGQGFSRLWDFLFTHRLAPLRLTYDQVLIDGKPVGHGDLEEDRQFWFPASWDELRSAAQAGVIEIGSHMQSHTPLPWFDEEQIRAEVAGSRTRLERELGCAVQACAYPHGMSNDEVVRIAGETYAWAFSNTGGVLGPNSSRSCAPRIHVSSDDWTVVQRVIFGRERVTTLLRRYAGGLMKPLARLRLTGGEPGFGLQ